MARFSKGIQAMVISALAFSTMAALVKLAAVQIPTQEIVALRSLASFLPIFLFMKWRGVSHRPNRPGLLFVRGLLGYAAISCWFLSLQMLELADAVMIQYTSPVFVALLAPFVLKERSHRKDRFALYVALIGVAMVVRPGLGLNIAGALIGLAGSLCSALAYLAVRELRKSEHPLLLMLTFPAIASVLSLSGSFSLGGWVWPGLEGWLLIAGIGAMTIVGQVFLTLGLMWEEAGRATVGTYFAVVASIPMGFILFSQWPDAWMLSGSALVIGSVVTLAVSAHRPAPVPAGAGGSRDPGSSEQAEKLARLSRID